MKSCRDYSKIIMNIINVNYEFVIYFIFIDLTYETFKNDNFLKQV